MLPLIFMAHTFFISDLHLSAKEPHISRLFLYFMQQVAPKAEALYVLGDLFDSWAGDDDLGNPFHQQITQALRAVAVTGTRLFIMHGNRDFLMAEKMAEACQATLLEDPVLIDLYGIPTLVTHGDTLCTDDIEYQSYRNLVRNPIWQQQFLAQPLEKRKSLIEELRTHSESEKQQKSRALMDVTEAAVAELLRNYGYPRLIHGHTHRPMCHLHKVDNHDCERWVLGDWHKTGNALRCDASGCTWENISDAGVLP